jgi:hypothetical protein
MSAPPHCLGQVGAEHAGLGQRLQLRGDEGAGLVGLGGVGCETLGGEAFEHVDEGALGVVEHVERVSHGGPRDGRCGRCRGRRGRRSRRA